MSQEFPNGVSYFTDGEISLTVHFPEDKVKCHYCPFCRSENDLNRYWCRLTNKMIYNPYTLGLPDGCRYKLMKGYNNHGNTRYGTRQKRKRKIRKSEKFQV